MERLYKVSKLLGFPASLLQLLESGKRWWAMGVKSVRKTVKLKLIPLSKSDRREPYSLSGGVHFNGAGSIRSDRWKRCA